MRWDAGRYDSSFADVTEHGKYLIDPLGPVPGERIVDLGCGTGALTAEIAAQGAFGGPMAGTRITCGCVSWPSAADPCRP